MSALVLPSVVPEFMPEQFMSDQGHHLEDCLKLSDPASAKLVAQLIVDSVRVDAYVPTIFTAETADNTPVASANEEEGEAHLARWAAVAEAFRDAVEDEASEVSAETRCCLENCDMIRPNLYLGGVEAAQDSQSLTRQGIKSVVCCNRDLEYPDSKFVHGLEYCRVDVEDVGKEPIGLFFPEATAFIHTQLSLDRPVLVHCTAGVSRSASVLLAYLIEYCGFSLADAFLLAIRLRPTVTPNPGFMEQLIEYEKEVRGSSKSSIDIRKYVAWFQAAERCPEPVLSPD